MESQWPWKILHFFGFYPKIEPHSEEHCLFLFLEIFNFSLDEFNYSTHFFPILSELIIHKLNFRIFTFV
jgi:hypothetical protein